MEKSNNKMPLSKTRKKRMDSIKIDPIEMKWSDLKFNGKRYTTLKIKVYDYRNNRDVTVYVSTKDLEVELRKYYFAPDGTVPKDLKGKAITVYDKYTVFLKREEIEGNKTKPEMKDIVEKNLYPNKW